MAWAVQRRCKMKILLSAYECAPDRGSEAGIGWNWALRLAEAGEQVWVITQEANLPAIEAWMAANPISNLSFHYVATARVPPAILHHVYGIWYPIYLDWQNRILQLAMELHRRIAFDAVHHVSWGSLQLGSKLWKLGPPFFYGPVGGGQTAPPSFRHHFGKQWPVELVRTAIVRHASGVAFGAGCAIRSADTVFVTNRETEALVSSLGARRSKFLWDSAVPDGWLREHAPPRVADTVPLRLIWVGTLMRRKGIAIALEVMEALRGDASSITLTILGDGPDHRWLQGEVKRRGLERHIRLAGRVSHEEVREAYDMHQVLLFTSLRESLGMQLFEAMARACAVVCLDMHGAATLVDGTSGLRVRVTEPRETVGRMARAVLALDRDREQLHELRLGALQLASTLDWRTKVEVARAIYREATEAGGRSMGATNG